MSPQQIPPAMSNEYSGRPLLQINASRATITLNRPAQHPDILGRGQAREMALQRQQVLDMQSVVLCRAVQRQLGAIFFYS